MKKAFISIGLLIALLALLFTACATQTTTPTTTTNTTTKPVANQPQSGGTLKIINTFAPANIGMPSQPAAPPDIIFSYPAVEPLFRLDKDGLPTPWLATGYKVGDDLKTITITLRQGVKFHDNTDFNADAVKYNLDLFIAGPRPDLKSITAVDVIDPYTVRLTTSGYRSSLMQSLTGNAGQMISPAALKANPKEYNFTHPVGTGPFTLASFSTQSVKFTKFAGYWTKGQPYLDGIEFMIVPEATVGEMALESGDANGMNVGGETGARYAKAGKFNVTTASAWILGLVPDSANPNEPTAKLEVRQAIAHAIDNKEVCRMGFGYWFPTNQMAPVGSFYYNPAITGYPYNPAKAKELLAKAGYPNGFDTKLLSAAGSTANPMRPVVQAYLKAVGINCEIEEVTSAKLTEFQAKGWQNKLVQLNFEAQNGADMANAFLMRLSGKAAMYVSVKSPEDYTALIQKAVMEPDAAKRKEMLLQVNKMAIDQYCLAIPIGNSSLIFAMTKNVHDVNMETYWYAQWTPETTWMEK